MADRIRLLPEVVANQIAAGEVVNRPSSVVKELMENAVDAGARSVKVNFRDGGRELIQIVDDGCGMSPIDARLAFDRHATSKIRTAEDIYALRTFGFRGEALASIAAVAQVELRTRQEGDEMGTATEINGGQFAGQQAAMCPVGAQFLVRNLFYNVPARRKFLDKSTVSAAQIRAEFQRTALCNPDIAFELYANDAPVYRLGASTLAGRIVDIVGRHIKQNLLEAEARTSIASVHGYIGLPSAAKRRNTEQYLFVNGRYFKSSYLASAVLKGYEKLIPANCQPSYFLYLETEPARIDVNVHPQKTEVKFADEEAVWQIVNAAVRETLARTGAVPLMDFDSESDVEIPVLERGAVYDEPRAASNFDYNPFREEYIDPSAPDPNVDFAGFDIPRTGAGRPAPGTAAGRGAAPRRSADAPGTTSEGERFEVFVSGGDALLDGGGGVNDRDGSFDASGLDFIPSAAEGEQQRLDLARSIRFTDPLPAGGGCAAALLDGRLVVVDLRRARERVLYEEYLRRPDDDASPGQRLLFAERLMLSEEEYAQLEEHAVEFAALGFDIDFCGAGTVEVRSTPADLPADAVDRLLYDLLQAFAAPVPLADVRRERIAAVLARNGARGALGSPTREETQALLDRLAATGHIGFSPSGGRITAEFTPEELRAKLG